MEDGRKGLDNKINTRKVFGPLTRFKNFFPTLCPSTFFAKYGASVTLIKINTSTMPNILPKVDKKMVKIVPCSPPKALAIKDKLNEIKMVSGREGINASRNGKSTAESGANHILSRTNC